MTNGTCKPKHFFEDFTMTTKRQNFDICSGSEEEEYLEVEVHSPTDSSEDSVEVKVSPICLRNKRKCAEPRKVQDVFQAPPKKRMCFKIKNEPSSTSTENPEPFRPWNADKNLSIPLREKVPESTNSINNSSVADSNFLVPSTPQLSPQRIPLKTDYNRPVNITPYRSRPPSPQPLPLIKKPNSREKKPKCDIAIKREIDCDPLNLRVPVHPHLNVTPLEAEKLMLNSSEAFPSLHPSISNNASRKEQRNYKNMTRERRIEANARERTRVHTISAAFETLRKSVPAYSHNQKLSKLSVLRIACSYIMTLSTLVDGPNSAEESGLSLVDCVESVSKTIQKEGKLRKKKDEGD